MAEFVYQMYKARKVVGEKVILDDVTVGVYPGAKIGVVGPNGMGKSTLLKVMAGLEDVSNGEARLTPGYTVGLLQQEPPLDEDKTVRENIEMAFSDVIAKVNRFNQIGEEMASPDADFDALMAEMGRLQDEIDAANGWDLDSQLSQAMDALQCPDPDAPVTQLSGGERRRVALCRLLLEAPDLLLLDEPTNHLDAESVLWLEQFLHNYPGAVMAVTHDRYFLNDVAGWICEVDRGQLYPYEGNYSTYLEKKAARLEAEGRENAKRAKKMRSELEWVRQSPKARQAKNRARLERYEQMEAEARATKKLDFSEIQIPVGPRLGAKVLTVEHLTKAFGDRVLIDDLSFDLPRNGIVGVIGPNGVGKTTLFKMIVGQEQPSSGALELGETVKLSYVDQMRAGIDPKKSVWEVVSDGNDYITVGDTEIPSRAYVATFGFKGTDQQKPAGVLSGGERNRLNLALTLRQGGNLLLLDEPTNDLDTETSESLEDALERFPGCSVVTSHDRWFLDRVATHILAWEGTDENPGSWHWFEGNFEAYQADRERRLGPEASKPHRLHRKLTRD
ncbi:energy-dependent translational throttle protein EttA [Olsenella sp. AF16-14LB]|jgi:ATP-binding cassette ChvD family protein|uniref:energy-dependent translational throttle protein EttA n=1 Tax=unclassified Olsenella TaxID=2638792 RepID=UPI000E42FE1E|nr:MULTISPECIES: energy-dependent translational throttle protein EttA [unclassified Olsenella]RGJ45353.1 energy-dependent translational throttle protein EttA [Olsenella sp. TM06-36]RGS52083.1 energy-dependent translational throttle protein EttA [Olsenella sp. AF21-51]RGU50101.1 energy-dependent translational throttle protein EttA [Olsenella sp. AF16-14LB]RGU81324.1 energy-dependent translational throttle protein EttA [Olsenella sp. AF15-43LB]RHB54459.1 energy-dependent translational throttle p